MRYAYERLGPERFQEFCQAILVHAFPGLQCFPVGQPDGGRDALRYARVTGKKEFVIYQVKFRRSLKEITPSDWLQEVIKKEQRKIALLAAQGAKHYVVLTNVPGTAHPGSGSIDQVQSLLDGLPLEAQCWWRNDIDRRLDGQLALKWAYPDILSGLDMLTTLLSAGVSEQTERRVSAIRAYVADQYEADRQVRFKQIELQNDLFDLFIDIPLAPIVRAADSDIQATFRRHVYRLRSGGMRSSRGDEPVSDDDEDEADPTDDVVLPNEREASLGTAIALLDREFQADFPTVVLEGAPGQGKSTLVQYVAQTHRLKLLSETMQATAGQLPASPGTRLPFKVDLRDLATWTSGKDPFGTPNGKAPPEAWDRALEAVLAAQVTHHSGGVAFSVADLIAVARASPMLLVLDGFDEVAEVERRTELVKTITSAITRLKANTLSLQVIVTSRPAAFAKSPGFREEDFPHLELQSVTVRQALGYARKWVAARKLPTRERRSFIQTFREKLRQSHLRDLARNPMQLAILLSLVHTRGASLPDKRTSLYDHYVDLFFSREAEKSPVVRDFRDLLVDLHRYFGWKLHCNAELDPNGGSVNESEFIRLIHEYLKEEDYDTTVVDQLFRGMVERVVALVSRIQGTYEFEVQPLREYFASRHLYETAPYSPTGNEQTGTMLDRFDALARNSYWLNVTRFYAGCFSKGELPALADSLDELWSEEPHKYLIQPRALGAMLLSDWVFSQHPKSQRRVSSALLRGSALRDVARSVYGPRLSTNVFVFTAESMREAVMMRCFEELRVEQKQDYSIALCRLARHNGTAEEIYARWREELFTPSTLRGSTLLRLAVHLGVAERLSGSEVAILLETDYQECLPLLVYSDRSDVYRGSEERFRDASFYCVEEPFPIYRGRTGSLLGALSRAVDAHMYEIALRESRHTRGDSLSDFVGTYYGHALREDENANAEQSWPRFEEPVRTVLSVYATEANRPVTEWAVSLEPWNTFVEKLRSQFGDCWAAYRLARTAANRLPTEDVQNNVPDLLDSDTPLPTRALASKRVPGRIEWWASCFERVSTPKECAFVILMAFDVADGTVLLHNAERMSDLLRQMDETIWRLLFKEFSNFSRPPEEERRLTVLETELPSELSPRLCVLFAVRSKLRQAAEIYRKRLLSYSGNDIHVSSACMDLSMLATGQRKRLWPEVLAPLRRWYAQGALPIAFFMGAYFDSDDARGMPAEIALQICREAELYPLALLSRAEAALRAHSGGQRTSISEIAQRDHWF